MSIVAAIIGLLLFGAAVGDSKYSQEKKDTRFKTAVEYNPADRQGPVWLPANNWKQKD